MSCNLCGARDADDLAQKDRRGAPLRTVICRRCGLVWSDPRPSGDQIARYYAGQYRQEYKGSATPRATQVLRSARVAVARARDLFRLLAPGGRVLDIGAGSGELVYVLRRLGCRAQGIEPDAQYAAFARERLGVPVDNRLIQQAAFAAGEFDAITLYHTLEHVEDPSGALSRAAAWLEPDGRLLVEVPNIEAVCQAPAHRFHFAHFYSYNAPVLEALGRKAGLDVTRTASSDDGGNVTVTFRKGHSPRLDQDGLALPENYDRIVSVIRSHTTLGHYLSATPYVRAVRRGLRHLEERRTVRRIRDPRAIVEEVLAASRLDLS